MMRGLWWSCLVAAACTGPEGAAVGCAAKALDDDKPDATTVDAGPCAGRVPLAGVYLDWDSTSTNNMPIDGASVVAGTSPMQTTDLAGHSEVCVPRDMTSEVTFTKTDYVPARLAAKAPASEHPEYRLYGIRSARLESFFRDDLGGSLTWDPDKALVAVVVRGLNGPVVDAFAGITGHSGPGFHRNADGSWASGATTSFGYERIVIPNVAPGEPALAFASSGGGDRCPGAPLRLRAGEVALVVVFCN